MESNTKKTPEIATWKKVAPAIGFAAGVAFGKGVKKSWGWGLGLGITFGSVAAIPYFLESNKLSNVSIKDKDATDKAESPTLTKEEIKNATPAAAAGGDLTTAQVIAKMDVLAEKNNKAGLWAQKKEEATKIIDGFSGKDRAIMVELMDVGEKLKEEKKGNKEQMFGGVMTKMAEMYKKYGETYVTDLMKKIKTLGV